MTATTIKTVQRPLQEVLDDAEPVIKGARIRRRSIGIRAKFGRKRLNLTAVQNLARSQEIVRPNPAVCSAQV
jgi:hypothetical protein